MAKVLVVANETLGGRPLIDKVHERHRAGDADFALVVPKQRPQYGGIIYDEAQRDAAQVRIDLATQFLAAEGIKIEAEIGDEDPYLAAMDAIAEFKPDELIVSTHPATVSGWLRHDLVQRIADASGLPVEHVVVDLDAEGLPFTVTLVVANRTVGGEELLDKLKLKTVGETHAAGEVEGHLFIVVVPQEGGLGHHAGEARERLSAVLERLRSEGLLCAGMIGDPDPYTAAMNALQIFRVSEVVISTLPEEKSGWMRAHLPERIAEDSGLPVEHVVVDIEAQKAQA